jgi:hypothetical protein
MLTEAGRSGGVHRSRYSTRPWAAAGIAEHYLQRGPGVAVEYGFHVRRLRLASGRQYLTALEWLLDVSPANTGHEPSPVMFGPHMVSSNTLGGAHARLSTRVPPVSSPGLPGPAGS